ncbi:MAG: tetratricopeptide repeat protein [Actinomycetota bacterium]
MSSVPEHETPITAAEQADAARETIARLEEQLRLVPKSRPFEQGVLRYNLGLAYQELPAGDRPINLSRATASLQKAAQLFDPNTTPVEHARTQNALGTALRELGQPEAAIQAFRRATELLQPAEDPGEFGAAANNLGLTLTDTGRLDEAIAAYEQAQEAFAGPEFARQRIALLHNLGQALVVHGARDDVMLGLKRYDEALELADPEEHPYQWALVNHSMGIAFTGIEEPQKAVDAFEQALLVFSRARFPFQYALTKNNLGLASAQLGDVPSLRRAVASFEDALRVLDTRLQREQWEQAYKNLELVEHALVERGEQRSRVDHFVRMLADEDDGSLLRLLRERVMEYTTLPEPQRTDVLAELDRAALGVGESGAARLLAAWLNVLMELPQEQFAAALRARMSMHEGLDDAQRAAAEGILDRVIQNELLAPQRIRVRDTLYEMGYERPTS